MRCATAIVLERMLCLVPLLAGGLVHALEPQSSYELLSEQRVPCILPRYYDCVL